MTAVREDPLSMMRSWLVVPAAGLVSLMLTYGAIALVRSRLRSAGGG